MRSALAGMLFFGGMAAAISFPGVLRAETRVEVPRDLGLLPRADLSPLTDIGGDLTSGGGRLVETHSRWVRALAGPSGGEQWRFVVPGDDAIKHLAVTDRIVALALPNEVVALEANTARRLWATAGIATAMQGFGADVLATFLVRPPEAKDGDESSGWPQELVRLDGATGRQRWRMSCPPLFCNPIATGGGELRVDVGDNVLVRLDADSGRDLGSVKLPGDLVLIDEKVVITAAGDRTPAKGRAGVGVGVSLAAWSLPDLLPIWQAPLAKADQRSISARRTGSRLVVFSGGEVDVFDWTEGTLVSRVALADEINWPGDSLVVIPDGRVVAATTVGTGADAIGALLVVDPNQAQPVALWSVPFKPRNLFVHDQLFVSAWPVRWRVVRWAAPLPPARIKLRLADDIGQRIDRLIAAAAAANEGSPVETEETLGFLRRLPRDVVQDAIITRISRRWVAAVDVPALVDLLVTPTGPTAPSRAALDRVVRAIAAELPRATPARQLRLVRGGLTILDVTRGRLPEAPMRAIGETLATLVRATWRGLSAAARAELALNDLSSWPERVWRREVELAQVVLQEADLFQSLLWRAPYPDLDQPLRSAVAAVGPSRPCPYPMIYYQRLVPSQPGDLTCSLAEPPIAAIRGDDWAVWQAFALGGYQAWGMLRSETGWSAPRFLDRNETALAVLLAKHSTPSQATSLRRVLEEAGVDSDGDGLADVVELHMGLDPQRADSDGDGQPDDRDPSPLCAPLKRRLTADEEIASEMAWQALGLRQDAHPVLLALPDAPAGSTVACIEIPTLGGPIIVGSAKAMEAIKARSGGLAIYRTFAAPLAPEERKTARDRDPGALGLAQLREAGWNMYVAPLNGAGHRVVVARIGGRWRVVVELMRFIS